jgi:probable rRNA maturation factor
MNTDCLSQPSRECDDRDEPGSSAEGDGPPERAGRPAPQPVDLGVESGLLSRDQCSLLRDRAAAIAPLLSREVHRIGIRIIDDQAMIVLHEQWHQKSTTTDVITFEASTDGPLEVDLVLCLDEAVRAAADRGHSVDDELTLYVVHGLLHCCGHDDTTEPLAAAMHREEDRVLVAIGLSAISAPTEGEP